MPLLRRQDAQGRLQGRAHARQFHQRGRQDSPQPNLGQLRQASAPTCGGDQAGARARAAAIHDARSLARLNPVTRKAVIGMVRAAALAGAFFLAGGAIPLLGGVLMMLAPAPIIIFAVGRPSPNLRATIAVLLAAAFVTMLAGSFAGAGYFVSFGLGTAIACYMLERRSSFELITAVGAGAIVAASVVAALVFMGGPDALIKTVHDELAQGMARGQDFYKLLGIEATVPADTQA